MSSTKELLVRIEDVLLTAHDLGRYGPVSLSESRSIRKALRHKQAQQDLARLRRRRLVRLKKKEGVVLASLTSTGKIEALRHRIASESRELPDGQICMVVFDVPEGSRRARDHFRAFLKRSGFVQLQRSVWCSSNDVTQEIQELIQRIGLKRWVSVFRSARIT